MKYILIFICLLLTGCEKKTGLCYEITDGSGRKGIYIKHHGYHLLRMLDTGNVESYIGSQILLVDKKACK